MANATCLALPTGNTPRLVAAPSLLLPLLLLCGRRGDARVALLAGCAVTATQWEPVRSLWCDDCGGTVAETAQWLASAWLLLPLAAAAMAFVSTASEALRPLRRAVPFAGLAYAAATPVLFAGLRAGLWGDLTGAQQRALGTTLPAGHVEPEADAALALRRARGGLAAQLAARERGRVHVAAQALGGALLAAAGVLTLVRDCDGATPRARRRLRCRTARTARPRAPACSRCARCCCCSAPRRSRRRRRWPRGSTAPRARGAAVPVRMAAVVGTVGIVCALLVAPQPLPRDDGDGADRSEGGALRATSAPGATALDGAALAGVGSALALYTPPRADTVAAQAVRARGGGERAGAAVEQPDGAYGPDPSCGRDVRGRPENPRARLSLSRGGRCHRRTRAAALLEQSARAAAIGARRRLRLFAPARRARWRGGRRRP